MPTVDKNDTIEFDARGLTALLKAFKNPGSVRVGVLGDKNDRTKGETNAKIGARHEYGDSTMPKRSFLRAPISANLQSYLDKAGVFEASAIVHVLREASLKVWLAKIGTVAENIVQDAFDRQGPGWAKWKGNYRSKTGMILQDTTQLRDSIGSEVVE